MITRHPFNTWPLHVKLFTEEAVGIWEAASAAKRAPPMPTGFTYSIELEGVDGKSGLPGSGRKGPIAVDDGKIFCSVYESILTYRFLIADFTNAYLAKHTSLVATGRRLECHICHKPMHSYATVGVSQNSFLCLSCCTSQEPLETGLCPSLHCTAVSHLSCLSQDFLISESADKENKNQSNLVPRGGSCKTCDNYILWGDVIRGSYRRFRAMQKTQDGADNTMAEDDLFISDEDEAEADEDGIDETPIKKKGKRPARDRSISSSAGKKSMDRKRSKKASSRSGAKGSSSGESFDFDNISSSSESEGSTVRRRGRPPKTIETLSHIVSPGPSKQSAKTKCIESVRRAPGRPPKGTPTVADIHVSFNDALESSDSNPGAENGPSRKPGRPRSRNSPASKVQHLVVSPPLASNITRKGKGKASETQETFTMNDVRAALPSVGQSRGKMGSPCKSRSSSVIIRKDDTENTVKRGRPRKSSITLEASSGSAGRPAQRKPGRNRSSSLSEVLSASPQRGGRLRTEASHKTAKCRLPGKYGFLSITDSSIPGKPTEILAATATGEASPIKSLSEVSKRGRPRKDTSLGSTNIALTDIAIPSWECRPKQDRNETSTTISSDPSTPEIVEKRRGRPHDDVTSSSSPETPVRKRGRPRKIEVILPPTNEIMTTSGSGLDKRKPGRPGKEKSLLSVINNVPIKQKRGRTSMDGGLIPSASSIKSKSKSTSISHKERMHTHSMHSDSSSGESFDFTGLSGSEASDEDFDLFLARISNRLKSEKVPYASSSKKLPGKPHNVFAPEYSLDICERNDLRGAISSLSVSNPGGAKNLPIVIISD